jgi:hypothetical protein
VDTWETVRGDDVVIENRRVDHFGGDTIVRRPARRNGRSC